MESEEERVIYSVAKALTPEVWGKEVMSLGLYEFWRRANRCVVTNRKVIHKSGVWSRIEQAIPLERIQDVQTQIGPLTGRVVISSAGKVVGVSLAFGPLWRRQAQELARAIQEQMAQRR